MSIAEEREKTIYERFKAFLGRVFYGQTSSKENEQNLLDESRHKTSVAVLKNWPRRETYGSICKQASTEANKRHTVPR